MTANPCKGRETGCTQKPIKGTTRCKPCAAINAARERSRRAARKLAGECTVCGRPVKVKNGKRLTMCDGHLGYYKDRAAVAR